MTQSIRGGWYWSEVKWSEVKWSEVKRSEMKWIWSDQVWLSLSLGPARHPTPDPDVCYGRLVVWLMVLVYWKWIPIRGGWHWIWSDRKKVDCLTFLGLHRTRNTDYRHCQQALWSTIDLQRDLTLYLSLSLFIFILFLILNLFVLLPFDEEN